MPLPKPSQNESKKKFIARCMGADITVKDFPDNEQRYAVCQDLYKKKSKGCNFNINLLNFKVEAE